MNVNITSEITPSMARNATNPYTVEQTLEKLRHYLSATRRTDALELLEKAVSKAAVDSDYSLRMEDALLRGSTLALRDLFSDFGDYFAPSRASFPFYPHSDNVNAIDSAMHHIKLGCEQEAIDDFNFLHNRPAE